MNGKEANEIMIGIGVIGIAAYFLWPSAAPVVPASEPGPMAQLAGLAIPNIPAYLSANRPGFAITPTPYQAAGGLLPVENAGAVNGTATTPSLPWQPLLQPNLDLWPGNSLMDLAPPSIGGLIGPGSLFDATANPGVMGWPVSASNGDDPSLPRPIPVDLSGASGACDCC